MRARLFAAALILLASTRATAEPAPLPRLNIEEPALVCTRIEPIRCRDLPPGVFTDAPTWARIDADRKVEQGAAVRLTAENESLRVSAREWRPGWRTLGAVIVVSLFGGMYLSARITK